MKRLLLAATTVFSVLSGSAVFACSASDISIIQADRQPARMGDSRLVGEMVNNCADAVGVALRIVLRDQAGKVFKSDVVWPASVANIQSHSSFTFSLLLNQNEQSPPTTMTVTVDSVRRW